MKWLSHHCVAQNLLRKDHVGWLVLHINVKADIVHRGVGVMGVQLLEHWWLMLEVLRWKSLSVMHVEGVEVGETLVLQLMHLVRETMHPSGMLSNLERVF